MKLTRFIINFLLAVLLFVSPVLGQRHRHRRTYLNAQRHRVHAPVVARQAPAGATARCRDGSYSFSENRRGTCSHHGGVAAWLR